MKKVLVVGATGSMGAHLTLELAKRGFEVVAFARGEDKLKYLFGTQPNVHIYPGDAFRPGDLMQAAQGVDIIYHTVNIPYQEWYNKLSILLDNIFAAAKRNHCKLAYVDNIYSYGPTPDFPIQENHPKTPNTRKGKLRLDLEQRIHEYHNKEEIPSLVAHFPDFYGPFAGNTLLNTTLQPLAEGKRGLFVGDPTIKREYIFLPDAAKAFVDLSLDNNSYGQNWNIAGVGAITGNEILQIAEKVLKRKCKSITIGKFALFIAGLFQPLMYEFREMFYLTESPVILDASKFEREIGPLPKTSYERGIQITLEALMNDHVKTV